MDDRAGSLLVPADVARIREVRGQVASFAQQAGMDADRAADVKLAVSEAVTNAVMHAFPEGAPGTVSVEMRVRAQRLVVVVADDGVGMRDRTDSPGAGFGLRLIRALADVVEHGAGPAGGAQVTMTFPLAGEDPAGAAGRPRHGAG